MRDRLQPHVLRRLRRQRRAHPARAEEDELLAAREEGLVIGALWVDPELDHAARHVAGAGDGALPPELPNVADIDELDVGIVQQPGGVLGRDGLDLGLGLGHQLADTLGDHARLPARRFGAGMMADAAPRRQRAAPARPAGLRPDPAA